MAKRESNAQRTAREYERRSPSILSNFQPIEVLETKVDYAKFYSRSHDALIRVYDEAGNVIETHEQAALSSKRHKRCRKTKSCIDILGVY